MAIEWKTGLQDHVTELLQAASRYVAEESLRSTEAPVQAFLRESSLSLIKLKCFNRNLQVALEARKKAVDSKRLKADSLQLDLENLRYKESYLQREIHTSRNLSTPQLDITEKELQQPLGTLSYTNDIKKVNEHTIQRLRDVQAERIDMGKLLEETTKKHAAVMDVLGQKRKFLEVDLPAQADALTAASAALEAQLEAMSAEDALPSSSSSLSL